MGSTLRGVWESTKESFWSEAVWLPPGWSWKQLSDATVDHPNVAEMYDPIALGVLFIFIRVVFEWCLARPLGVYLGLPDTGSALPHVLLRVRNNLAIWWHGNGDSSSKSPDQLQQWRIVITKSTLDKFCEHTWRFAFYTFAFLFGLYTLWDKSWMWDTSEFWVGYPYHPVPRDIALYYKIEAGFYWSLMISQFTDVQRKDFQMMFIHHVATLLLIWFSWVDNFVRVGSLILVIHDAADIWLDLTKMFRFLGKAPAIMNGCSYMFAITWFVTRCMVLPYVLVRYTCVLYSTMIEAPCLIVWFPVYYIFNMLLVVLQVLHIIWSYMIVKAIYAVVVKGFPEDVRSDEDSD